MLKLKVCKQCGFEHFEDIVVNGFCGSCRDKRTAAELEAWRSGPLHRCPLDDGRCRYAIDREDRHEWEWFDTIEAAVDALMAEGEE